MCTRACGYCRPAFSLSLLSLFRSQPHNPCRNYFPNVLVIGLLSLLRRSQHGALPPLRSVDRVGQPFLKPDHLSQSVSSRGTVCDRRYQPECSARALLFRVAPGEILSSAECRETVANNHADYFHRGLRKASRRVW